MSHALITLQGKTYYDAGSASSNYQVVSPPPVRQIDLCHTLCSASHRIGELQLLCQ